MCHSVPIKYIEDVKLNLIVPASRLHIGQAYLLQGPCEPTSVLLSLDWEFWWQRYREKGSERRSSTATPPTSQPQLVAAVFFTALSRGRSLRSPTPSPVSCYKLHLSVSLSLYCFLFIVHYTYCLSCVIFWLFLWFIGFCCVFLFLFLYGYRFL